MQFRFFVWTRNARVSFHVLCPCLQNCMHCVNIQICIYCVVQRSCKRCHIVSLLFSPLELINNERHKKSLVPPFLTINIMPYYSLCKMVIFATSQIRTIFLPIRCFINQLFSHETTLMRFSLICAFF